MPAPTATPLAGEAGRLECEDRLACGEVSSDWWVIVGVVVGLLTLVATVMAVVVPVWLQNRASIDVAQCLTAEMVFGNFPETADAVVVQNHGSQPVHEVVWWDGLPRKFWADAGETTHGGYAQIIVPGAEKRWSGPFYGPFTEGSLIELDFVDYKGRRWRKTGSARTERVRDAHYRDRYPFMEDDPLIPLA